MSDHKIVWSFEANTRKYLAAQLDVIRAAREASQKVREAMKNGFDAAEPVGELKKISEAAKETGEKVQQAAKSSVESWMSVGADATVALHGARRAAELLSRPLAEFARGEDVAARLAPLVGGLETGTELARALRLEAANGTQSFEQLASVAGRLASVFKSTDSIKKWTTAFHDLAAGTGLDVNELVGNFVRSKASGRFEAGFMDMFAQKGVNLFPELVRQTGQSEAALRKMAAAGTLAFSEVEKAILAVSTGTGKFAGQAAKLSNTFGGSVGTLPTRLFFCRGLSQIFFPGETASAAEPRTSRARIPVCACPRER